MEIEKKIANELRNVYRDNPESAKKLATYFNELYIYIADREMENMQLSIRDRNHQTMIAELEAEVKMKNSMWKFEAFELHKIKEKFGIS